MLHTQRANRVQRIAFLSLIVFLIGVALLSNFQSRAARVSTSSEISAPSPFITSPLPAPTCAPPPPNMTAWFPGEGDANNLIDSNHGALHGGLGFAAGKVGQAFNLDGLDDYVSVANAPALNFGTGDFSIDAWVKTTSTGLQIIVDKRVDNRAPATPNAITGYGLFTVNGLVGFQMDDGGAAPGYDNFISSFSIADGQFHHIAVTVNRGSTSGGKIYVDNLAPFTFNPTVRPGSLSNTAELRIGRISTPNQDSLDVFFNGCIDELEIFNRALTATEVSDIRNADSAGKCKPSCVPPPAGLVSWYPGEGNANDIAGSNNGTLQNGATFAAGKVGQAFSLDGVDDYVDLGSGFNLDKLTLDAWVFVDPATNTGERRVISKDNAGLPGTRKLFALKSSSPFVSGNNGRASFIVLIDAALDVVEAPSALTAGWHHLAGVRDTSASRFELYVDGVMVASQPNPAVVGAIDSSVNTVLGRVSPSFASEHFAGRIDEAEIFNQALSGGSILSLFNAGGAGKCHATTCALIPPGLVSWYPGENNANDIIGSNNGTLANGTAFAAGKVGQAFNLDGADDYVDLGAGFNLDQMALDAWVFIDPATNTGERRVISKDNYLLPGVRKLFALKSSSHFISGQDGHAAFGVLIDSAFDVIEAPSALTSGWHHLAAVRDTAAGRFELYVDGTMVASKPALSITAIGPIDSAVNTVIGTVSPTSVIENFAGRIDEVEIFNSAISASQIQAIVNANGLGKCKTDLSITKTDSQTSATPGTPITYTITVTNNGSIPVTGATVTDTLPGAITNANWSCVASPGSSCGAASGNGNISTTLNLLAGGTATFTVTGDISSAATGTLSNTASVAPPAGVLDTNLTNNSQTDTDTLTPQADLKLTKIAAPDPVFVGSNLTYTLKVENFGPSDSAGSTVTDVLPAGVIFVSASAGCTNASGTVTCMIGPLASGANTTATIIVRPTAAGPISNTAQITAAATPDSVAGNESSIATVTAQTPPCAPPPAGLTGWWPGDGNANDIKSGNHGALQNGATATAAGLVRQAFTFDGVDDFVNVPNNAALEPKQITVDMWVNSANPGAAAYLLAKGAQGCSYASYSFNNVPGDNVANGDLAFDVLLSGSGFKRSPGVPKAMVFDGNWHHVTGTYDGAKIRIYLDGVEVGSGTDATGDLVYGLSTTNDLAFGRFNGTCTLSYAGALDEIEIFDHALTPAEIQSLAQAYSTGKCQADLSIAKTHSPSTGTPGEPITFTISVVNNGFSAANGATVTDNFPAGISGVNWTCVASPGSSCGAANGSGNINTTVNLAVGGNATFTATGLISSAATGSLLNTASVTAPADVLDPIATNNNSPDTVPLAPKTDLTISKTASPDPVFVGSNLTYTIKVKNNGPSNSSGSTVTDVLPGNVIFVSASPGCTNASGTVTCAMGPLPSGATATATIIVKPTAAGPISNTASVAANETDPGPGVNTSTAAVTAQIPPCVAPPANMSAWFTGEGTANDIVSGNVGTLHGGSYTAGKVGQAFNLDGINNYVSVPNAASLNFGTGDFSIDAWIKTSVSDLQTIVDKRVESPAGVYTGYSLFIYNGQLGVQLSDGTNVSGDTFSNFFAGPNVADGIFHHVAVTVTRNSATGGKLFVDGVVILTFDPTSRQNSLTNTAELRIGGHSLSYPQYSFNGLIDEVEIFKRALSESEIQGIAVADLSGKCRSDLSITKTHSPSTGTPGLPVTFTITATNNGPLVVSGATVNDTFPAGISGVNWTCAASPGSSCGLVSGSGNISTTVNLAVGGTATFTATGTISSAAVGSLTNTATVTSPASVADSLPSNNSASDTVPLLPKTDLTISKTAAPDPVFVGSNLTYTIKVKNNGPSNSSGSTVTDVLPGSVIFVSASAGCTNASGTVTCAVGPLANGVTKTLTIIVKPTAAGPISNTASVAANDTDPGPGVNTSTAAVTAQIPPCAPPPANMTAWFTGDNAANDIVSGNVGTMHGGSYTAGKVAQAFKLDGVDDYVSVPNATSLNFGTGDFSLDAWIKTTNNSGLQIIVDKRVESPHDVITGYGLRLFDGQLGVQLADGTNVGGDTFTNFYGGPNVADGIFHHVAVTVTRNSATGGKLFVDGAVVFTFDPRARQNTLTNTAELRIGAHSLGYPQFSFGGLIDEVEFFKRALAESEIQAIAIADLSGKCRSDLSITKTHSPSTGTPGLPVTFTITATNNGPLAVSGAAVNDTFPAGITGVNWTCAATPGSSCGAGSGSGNINTTVNLAVGGHATFTATGTIVSAATISLTNTATVTSPASVFDPLANNNSASDTVPLLPKTDLQITKTASPDPVFTGAPLTYTIKVKNNGPSDSSGSTVKDVLPGSVTFVSASPGCTNASGTVTCAMGPIASGATATVTITVKPTTPGSISNTAQITAANETDPGPGANTSTATVTAQAPPCVTAPANLVSWWQGENNANDIKSSNHGTLLNGATFAAGKVGQAFSFDGVNDFVEVPDNSNLEPATTLTVDMWVKSASPGSAAYLLAKGAQACSFASYSFNRAGVSGDLAFDITVGSGTLVRSPFAPTGSVFDGNWHHVAGTYDGAFVRLYVDGVEQGTGTATSGSIKYGLSPTDNLTLGRFNGSCTISYAGLLDEIEIFNRALSAAEIKAISDADLTGKCRADLSITKTHSPSTGTPGLPVTFTIKATNNSALAVSGATVNDTFPAGISGVSWTCAATSGSSCGAGSGSGNISTTVNLAVGGTATFTATGTIVSAATGSLTNTATVTPPANLPDPIGGNNSASDTVPLAPKTDLAITKTALPNPVFVGSNLAYTIKVQNNGPSDSSGSIVTDVLPSSVAFISASAGCTNASGTVTCAIGPLTSGAMTTLTIIVKPTATGTISNTATVAAAVFTHELGTPSGNNTSTATVTAQAPPCVAPPANMSAWFTGNNTANDIVSGNIGTLHSGAGYAAGKVGQAFNLDGVDDYVSVPNDASLNLGTSNFSIDAWIKTSASGLQIIVDKRVESPATIYTGYGLFLYNGQLGVQLADGTNVGGNTYSNFIDGPNVADGIFHHVAVTVTRNSATGGKLFVDGVVVSTFDPTARQNSLTNTAELRIGGHSLNYPSFSFNGLLDEVEIFKRALSESEIQSLFAADAAGKCQADLSITKTHSPSTGTPGQAVTFTITVTNSGPRPASGATVIDNFPAGISGVNWTCAASSGSSCGLVSGSGNINTTVNLAVAGTATFTATGTISSSAIVSLTNTATVTAPSSVLDPMSSNNSASDTVPLLPKTDLQITKTDAPDPVIVNTNLTYTITAKNNGPSDATNVKVVDTLPGTVTFIPGSSSAGCVEAPAGTVTCTIGNLASGAQVLRTIVVKPTVVGQISNTAVITGNETDPNSSNNTTPAIKTNVNPVPCLPPPAGLKFWMPMDTSSGGITKDIIGGLAGTLTNGASIDTSTPGRVGPGALSLNGLNDFVRVPNNAALEPASAITVDLWFKSSAPGFRTYLLAKGQETCSFASYSFNLVGLSGNLSFDVATTAGYFRSPEASPSVFDGNWHLAAGTYDSASGKVRLFIDGVEQGTGTPASGSIRYGLSTNNDLVIGRYDPDNVSCAANIFNYNGLIDEVEVFNVALPATGPGSIQAIYNVGTGGKCRADLVMTKTTASPSPIDSGTNITYTLKVENQGTLDATGVTITDPLPGSMQFVSASPDCSFASGVVTCNIGTLANGGIATRTLTVKTIGAGPLNNTATVTGNEFDPNPGNNSSTAGPIMVTGFADLCLVKYSLPGTVTKGDFFTYRLEIQNSGPVVATNVNLIDPLPVKVFPVSVSFTSGGGATCTKAPTVTCNFPTINSGETKVVLITVKALLQGTLFNMAAVSADSPDPHPDNNSALAVTTVKQ